MDVLDKELTLNEIANNVNSGTTYGSVELDSGNAAAWAKESPREWVFDLPDMNRQLEVDVNQIAAWADEPERNQLATDVIGGIKSVGTQIKNAWVGMNLLGLKYTTPNMNEDEAKQVFDITGRYLVANREAQQELIQREGIDTESLAFGATNAIGQAVITTAAGLLTQGAALPVLIGSTQMAGAKVTEYATTYAERGGDLRQQPAKDDAIAIGLGAIEGLLDKALGAERLFSQIGKKGIQKQVATAIGGEAAEEFIQEYTEYAGNIAAGYEDRTIGEVMADSLKSAIFGGLAGGTMGTGLYMVHRSKLQSAYEGMGYEPQKAKELAIEAIDTGKTAVIQEMRTRAELKLHYGEAYTELENKIRNVIEATGRADNIAGDFNKYVETVTRGFANQIMNVANLKGVSTKEILDISDIEQEGNVLRLNTPDMKSEVELRRQLRDKKERAKALKADIERKKAKKLGIEGKTDEETAINLKIQRLENQLAKATDDIELAEKTTQVKALRDEITRIRAEKKGIEADTQRETALNLQINALERRLDRMKEDKGISDSKRAAKGLPKANTHAKQALKDARRLKAGVNLNNFVENLTKAERKKVTNTDGSINNVAVQRRYNDAVLAKIINDPNQFERLILSGSISQDIMDKIISNSDAINLFNQNYAEYGLNEDIKDALSLLEDTTRENFAQKATARNMETPFGATAIAYTLLYSENSNLAFKQFINLYEDSIEIYGSKGDPRAIKNDMIAEAMRYSPLNIGKFEEDGSTNDVDLLAVFANINNTRRQDLIPDESGIYPLISDEAEAIKATIDRNLRVTEKGASLSTFIRGAGGIYDFGGELANRGIKTDIAKKEKSDKSGKRYLELDNIIEYAFDNGYFPEKNSWEDISHDEMIGAIEQDYFTDNKIRPEQVREENTEIVRAREELNFLLDEVGIDTKDSVEMIAEKLQQYYLDNNIPLNKPISAEDVPERFKDITFEGFEFYQTDINSQAFKNWFKDSKVVDDNGEPLIVYHGGGNNIRVFDYSRIGEQGRSEGAGFEFTSTRDIAEGYAERHGKGFYEVYLSIQNPITDINQSKVSFEQRIEVLERFNEKVNQNEEYVSEMGEDSVFSDYGGLYEAAEMTKEDTDLDFINEFINITHMNQEILEAFKEVTGYDGVIITEGETEWENAGLYVAFTNTQIKSIDNIGTFSEQSADIYTQRRKTNASYNPNTKEIILGKNFNTMSLPHEMAHFWLDYIFNDVTLWRQGADRSQQYLIEIGELWEFLGVKDNQTKLTRDQQEQFATLTEQYLTQRTALPQGTEYAVKEYLDYVPDAYNTFLDFGYIDSKGKVQNPIMTEDVKEWFDRFFTNWTASDAPSPTISEIYEPTIQPSSNETQAAREENIKEAAQEEKTYTDKAINDVDDKTPVQEKINIAAQGKDYEQEAENILLPPEKPTKEKFSFVRFGRGTNTREAMSQEAVKWVSKNKEEALEIALSDPRYIANDSPIDRGILIRAVMADKTISKDKTMDTTLKMNFAFTKSMSGKTLGLSNDTSDSLFLQGLGKAENNYLQKYLLKRYGNKSNGAELLERELDKFVRDFAPRIVKANKLQQGTEIKRMLEEAAKIFGKSDDELFQTDIPSGVLKDENKFINFAKQLVRKHAGALPSDDYTYNLMNLATQAQMATPDLNSDDLSKAIAAARAVRKYQDYLIQSEIPQSISDKIIGGFASRSMLSGISTHLKNLVSNSLEVPVVKAALTAKYGKSEVSRSLIKAEADRMTKIYEDTLISIPQMHTLNDRSLVAGEIYRIADTNTITLGGVKVATLGDTKIPDPLALLGRSDFYFRRISYLQTLAHKATAEAKKTGRNPDEVFNEMKQIGVEKASDARLEAILVSNVSVFTHNGELSRVVGSIRRSLDEYTAPLIGGHQHGLGTLVAPFVKTPSNILQLGAEALASPFSIARTKIRGGEVSTKQYIDVAHLAAAATIAAAVLAAGCDYEPPYKVGNRYNRKKHYDSIKIGNTWFKLDALGVLEMPLRLLISVKDGKVWSKSVEGTIAELPIDFGQLEYALKNPKRGFPYFIESQLTKGVPAATSLARPFIRETGATMPTYGKIGSQLARRLGLDGRDNTINDYVHILASFVSIEE